MDEVASRATATPITKKATIDTMRAVIFPERSTELAPRVTTPSFRILENIPGSPATGSIVLAI